MKAFTIFFSVVLFLILFSFNSAAVLKTWDGSTDLWNDGTHWSPAGVPTSSDDVQIASGMAVVLNADGICSSLDVSGTGFAIVNHADRTLRVEHDARVSNSSAELRANLGLLDIAGTAFATNGGQAVIDGGIFKASSVTFGTGTLVWHSGTLQLTDTLYIGPGTSLQSRKITSGQHLVTHGEGVLSADIYMLDNGVLTLEGGTISCDGLIFSPSTDFKFYDGTLTVNGADFTWSQYTILLEGNTSSHIPHLVLNGLYFPIIYDDFLLATSQYRKAALSIIGTSRIAGNAVVAGGLGSFADVLVDDYSEWQPTTLTLGGSGYGTLTITNHSLADSCQEVHIGRYTGSTGILHITDSSWSSYWKTYVGEYGHAVITAQDGSSVQFGSQIQDPIFGDHAGSEARLTITDPGSSLSISPDSNSHTFRFGKAGYASLIVSNSAQATFSDFTIVGDNTGGRGDVVVTGPGSRWRIESDCWLGYEGLGTLQVLDGATTIWDSTKLGEFPKGEGNVRVSGAGSYWHGGGYEVIGEEFLVGRYGIGTVRIENGATLHSSGYSKIGEYDASRGSVTVTGQGSSWSAGGDLSLGSSYFTHGTGTLTVADSGYVYVNKGISINYSGTLNGNGGTVRAAVNNLYGTIAPGSSIGTLVLDGTFNQQPGGTVSIELSGKLITQHDRLIVTGLSTLAGTLDVTLAGYTPSSGDTFDIFDWVGGTHGSFDTVTLPDLLPGLLWSTNNLYSAGELHVFPEPSCMLSALLIMIAAFIRKGKYTL